MEHWFFLVLSILPTIFKYAYVHTSNVYLVDMHTASTALKKLSIDALVVSGMGFPAYVKSLQKS